MKEEQSNSAHTSATCAPPSLWNPNALANWSLLLSPLFGAYLVAENYKAMEKASDAKKAMEWFYIGSAVLLSTFLLVPFGLFGASMVIYIGYLFSWYFMSARRQNSAVLLKYGKSYERRPWGKVLVIGIAANVVWQVIVKVTL
ncbi:MAG TPA: hypothetical protein DE312_13225 [Gallionella sp.]|nr:hypothetical protein [Gallionella sp.]